jgi:heat shock protein HslJ
MRFSGSKFRPRALALCAVLAPMAVSGSEPVSPAAGAPTAREQPPLVGTPWRLEDLDRKGIIDRSRITLVLGADGRLAGHAGCNRYFGSYTLESGTLRIDERIGSTRMACAAESLMYQEQRFFELLPLMHEAAVDETGALILGGEGGASMKFHLDEDAGRVP